MSNLIIGTSPIERDHGVAGVNQGRHNLSPPGKVAVSSAMRIAQAALAELDSPEETRWLEQLTFRLRRSRIADGMDVGGTAENTSDYLEQLLGNLEGADWTTLETLLNHLPGFEQEVGLFAGAEGERWHKLKEALKSKRGKLKETLIRYLKQHGGEVAIGLLSFLEFGNNAQLDTMKGLYRYVADSCQTMTDLFKYLIQLNDRETRLRALLHAVGFELARTDTALNHERERLATIIGDVRRLLVLLGLTEACQRTAEALNEKIEAEK